MAIELQDGGGTGLRANVTEDSEKGRLDVSSRTADRIYYANRAGDSYVVLVNVTPAAGNDVFFYMKNTAQDVTLVVDWYRLCCGNSETFDFFVNQTGVPGGDPTPLTPINLNLSSGSAANGEFYEDPDITGLVSGDHIDRIRPPENVGGTGLIPGGLRLTQNTVFTIQAVTGGSPIEATIGFHFEK
jgi:hypothetical protein